MAFQNAASPSGAESTLPKQLVDQMQAIFGKHAGYRTTHAKGLLVEGTFTPTENAKSLSVASHFNDASTPVIARFSVGGGIPRIPDVNENATPKGIAIRFKTDGGTHTDLISHSFDGFATRTGEDFLAFLKLVLAFSIAKAALKAAQEKGGDSSKEKAAFDQAMISLGAFLKDHASANRFLNSDKPNPLNYGTITYYEPNTHVLTNSNGQVTNVRYRLDPADGVHLYTADQLPGLAPNYLEDDLEQRFPSKPIVFTIQAHIADANDVLDDATVPYKSTSFVTVGKLTFNAVADDNVAQQKQIAFSPNPELGGVKGIAASQDPLIQVRKGVYAISAEQRRSETQE